MKRLLAVVSIGLLLSVPRAGAIERPGYADDPRPLTFRIVATENALSTLPGTRAFLATWGAGDSAARFLVVLGGPGPRAVDKDGKLAPLDIRFAKGQFRHVAGSKPEPFLHALAVALEAKAPKRSAQTSDAVPFAIAILGAHENRAPNGGFDGKPGDWVATKLFLAGRDAEVFFNFNPVSGDAEFSIKDEAYGNTVVEELSKVLW